MFFKNARIFRFTKPFSITAEQLEEKLSADAFVPCGPQETVRMGWASPLGRHSDMLVHNSNGYFLICLQVQEKILPSSVVNDFVNERCEAIEDEQDRKVRRKERAEIKEQVMLELLPQAFHKNRKVYGYLSMVDGCLVVDASSANAAEGFASYLRKSLGSLPIRPIAVEQSPAFTFTGWLNGSIDVPGNVALGSDCWLTDPSEDGGKVIARGLDLQGDDVRSHIDAGMQATKVALVFDDNVFFCLDADLAITRLKFSEEIQEPVNDIDADDELSRFDASFTIMAIEMSGLITGLLEALGGEDRSSIIEGDAVDPVANAAPDLDPEENPSRQGEVDPIYGQAVNLVISEHRVGIAFLQRNLKIGFNRAASLVDAMEDAGVVSTADSNGAREVLVLPETVSGV